MAQQINALTCVVDTSLQHIALSKQCRICKQDFAVELYDNTRVYCPDCEKALGEIIKWWNGLTQKLARNEEQIEKAIIKLL